MSCKLLLVLCGVISILGLLEAASLNINGKNTNALVDKFNFKSVQSKFRNARQAYSDDNSGEDSDEDDDEDDAELQHQAALKQQQAYQQSLNDSEESSDEDNVEQDADDHYFGRRFKRDEKNEIEKTTKTSEINDIKNEDEKPTTESSITATATSSGTPNTSVLLLIRDVIKKVTEIPTTQQVTTNAQQYFQLFQHFLQQTIEQVIGDDDDDEDEDEIDAITIIPEDEKETVTESIPETTENPPVNETSDKENSIEHEVPPKPEKKTAQNITKTKKL